MDIHDRVSELEARISKLEPHLQRLVWITDPSLQPVKRVMLELDAPRGQETAMLDDRVQRILPGDDPESAL